jgi:hypothetical protein
VCGNSQWVSRSTEEWEVISFGKDASFLFKFKRIIDELPFLSGRAQEKVCQAKEHASKASQPIEVSTFNGQLLQPNVYDPYKRQVGMPDRAEEVSQLKKEIEELSQWFRDYGSEGLLTNRG